jgi:hypothetical protein
MPHLGPLGAGIIMVMTDTDAVRWYRAPGDRWGTVFAVALVTVLLDGVLIMGAVTTPGARVLSLTGAVLVCCAGCAVVVLRVRAGVGVTADHLIVWDAAFTRHLIAWPSVAGFGLEKWHGTHGSRGLTLVVICSDGRRLHTSGCLFAGTGERSWAAARQMVRALEAERQARTTQRAGP